MTYNKDAARRETWERMQQSMEEAEQARRQAESNRDSQSKMIMPGVRLSDIPQMRQVPRPLPTAGRRRPGRVSIDRYGAIGLAGDAYGGSHSGHPLAGDAYGDPGDAHVEAQSDDSMVSDTYEDFADFDVDMSFDGGEF